MSDTDETKADADETAETPAPAPLPATEVAPSPERKWKTILAKKASVPVWALAVGVIVLLAIGAAIGGPREDTSGLESKVKTLRERNEALQDRVTDRQSQIEADEAAAARLEAVQEAKAAEEAERVAAEQAEAAERAATEQAAAAAAEAKRNTVTGGVYAIGPDINPGRWRSAGPGPGGLCYYAILNSPDTSDISTNSIPEGPTIAELPEGKFFETSGCQPWTHE